MCSFPFLPFFFFFFCFFFPLAGFAEWVVVSGLERIRSDNPAPDPSSRNLVMEVRRSERMAVLEP